MAGTNANNPEAGALSGLGVSVRRAAQVEARKNSTRFGAGPFKAADVAALRSAVLKAAEASGATPEQLQAIRYDDQGAEFLKSSDPAVSTEYPAGSYRTLPSALTGAALGLRELAAQARFDPETPEVRPEVPGPGGSGGSGGSGSLRGLAQGYDLLGSDESFRGWAQPPDVASGGAA